MRWLARRIMVGDRLIITCRAITIWDFLNVDLISPFQAKIVTVLYYLICKMLFKFRSVLSCQ